MNQLSCPLQSLLLPPHRSLRGRRREGRNRGREVSSDVYRQWHQRNEFCQHVVQIHYDVGSSLRRGLGGTLGATRILVYRRTFAQILVLPFAGLWGRIDRYTVCDRRHIFFGGPFSNVQVQIGVCCWDPSRRSLTKAALSCIHVPTVPAVATLRCDDVPGLRSRTRCHAIPSVNELASPAAPLGFFSDEGESTTLTFEAA